MNLSDLNILDRADLVRSVIDMRDRCEIILGILMPDGEEPRCKHPADKLEERGDMGDDIEYHCKACNTTQDTPFHSEV